MTTAAQAVKQTTWQGVDGLRGALTMLVGVVIWMLPVPAELSPDAWHLFAIFMGTIAGVILRPMPIAPTVLTGMVLAMVTGTTTFDALFAGFSSSTIWLIVFAFFMAQGLIKTGLAKRASYHFVAVLGKSTIGLAYGLIFSEVLLAPFIPSLVARSAGILFPLTLAVAKEHDDGVENSAGRNTARFLMLAVFQGSVICSGLFMTSMAANPLAAQLAAELGITVSWGDWALAAIVPGAISLAVVPYLIYRLAPPGVKETPEAPRMAREKLAEMGAMTTQEWMMVSVFSMVLGLWIAGPMIGIGSTLAVMIGLVLLMAGGVLSWNDCLEEKTAWNTLIWLSGLIAMGSQLKALGFFDWLGAQLLLGIGTPPWQVGFLVICLAYFYSHYFFASNTAHLMAMFFAFLMAAVQLGTPPKMAAIMLGILSNLFGGLTHYGNAPAPLYFSTGYASLKTWWTVGGIISLVNLAIWLGVAPLWWKVIGIW